MSTTMEKSGFEDISDQSSTSEEHEETEKNSEKTEENQTIVLNIKSVNKCAENKVNVQKNVNNPWMNGMNEMKKKVQEEKKTTIDKPTRSNLKGTAVNTTLKKGKETKKEVNPTIRKPTLVNLC